MNDDDRRAMAEHGITVETRQVFHYRNYRYDRLDDAIRYAKIEEERSQRASEPS